MAQYEPFRRTYVSDPACVPQLRFANVPDAGADHHKRETSHHWRRSGRTWSRVPRFRKGIHHVWMDFHLFFDTSVGRCVRNKVFLQDV